MHSLLKDVQSEKDERKVLIKRVGIQDLVIPICIKKKGRKNRYETQATVTCSASLPSEERGTHMSRFCKALTDLQTTWEGGSLLPFLKQLRSSLASEEATVEIGFEYLLKKLSPVTQIPSYLSYTCEFEANLYGEKDYQFWMTVDVPITTVCPCSKEISEYGAHNQRATASVHVLVEGFLWLEDLIELVESCGSCELYTILKRPDEKYVTEKAFDNPKFVEDVLRDIVTKLRNIKQIKAFDVEVESHESIHNHAAFAWTQEVVI